MITDLNQHKLETSLRESLKIIQQLRAGGNDNECDYLECLDRAYTIISFISSYLLQGDPYFIRGELLDELDSIVHDLIDALSDTDCDNRQRAVALQLGVDKVLTVLPAIFIPKEMSELHALRDSIIQFRRSLNAQIGAINRGKGSSERWLTELEHKISEVDKIAQSSTNMLNDLQNQIKDQQQASSNIISELTDVLDRIKQEHAVKETAREEQFKLSQSVHQNEFTLAQEHREKLHATAESEREQKFSDAQDIRNKEFLEAQNMRNSQFADAQISRDNAFSTAQTEREQQFLTAQERRDQMEQARLEELEKQHLEWSSNTRENFLSVLETIKSEVDDKVRAMSTEFNEQIAYIAKLVGLAANTSMAGGYLEVATQEAKSALIWRRLAVASMMILASFAIAVFFIKPGGVSWSSIGERLFVTLTVGGFSTYAAAQAALHRKAERENRKMHLELTTLGPYINSLPINVQHNIKTELSRTYFGLKTGIPATDTETNDVEASGSLTSPTQLFHNFMEVATAEAKQHIGQDSHS